MQRQVGNALGMGIAAAIQNHRNPGQRSVAAVWQHQDKKAHNEYSAWSDGVHEVLARHQEVANNQTNRVILLMYVQNNHLSPEETRSWEKAYTNLKSDGKLELQSQQTVKQIAIAADSKQRQEFSTALCPYDGDMASLQDCQIGTQTDICTYSHLHTSGHTYGEPQGMETHRFTVVVPK